MELANNEKPFIARSFVPFVPDWDGLWDIFAGIPI
jgi:hypothetical protein